MSITVLIIAILEALALAIVWLGGWFFGIALSIEIGISVLFTLCAAAAIAIAYLLRLRAASRLEKDLLAQGAKQAEAAVPDRRREVMALQQQVAQAIATLKRSSLGKSGRTALYALPWYVIVGPPGTGKTTAIRHSGLDFPLDQGNAASAFRGTGGTRNCDWWFTNEAILLDTAGRYSTDSNDQQEWFAFLDLLKKNRPGKPINGLIVALALSDLQNASEEQVVEIAKRMRSRVDEVTTRLKMRVPIYVLFTKTDMVAGFSEFWNDLRKSERGQPWGAGFPIALTAEPGAAFEQEIELLMQTLQARAVRRLWGERNVQTRRLLWMFPVEFATVRTNTTLFITSLFQKNAFQETPLLRGAYFTSGTQNARPMSRVVSSMASAFGLRPPGLLGAAPEPKSFFLTDVFRRVMFADQTLAGQTDSEKRKRLLLRLAMAAMAMLVAAAIAVPAFFTFLHNHELVRSTADIARGVQGSNWADTGALPKNAPTLDAAQARLRQLGDWKDNGAPVHFRWGMYVGDELYSALRGAYVAAVDRAIVAQAKADLEDRLRGMDSGPVRSTETFNRDFDTLKLYLMLGDPAHMDAAWAAPRLVHAWALTSHARAKGEEELLLPHVVYEFDLIAKKQVPAWELDPKLITGARSILSQVPQLERLYESLVRDANSDIAPIRREAVFYGAVAPFIQSHNGVKVPGAYTKQGWARVRALLGEQRTMLAAEQWVLGSASDIGADGVVDKLRGLYFDRYTNAWRDFLADFQVQDPGGSDVAMEELNALSEPEWPYLRLIRLLSDNVLLDVQDSEPPPDAGTLDKAIDRARELLDGGSGPKKRVISPVERAYKPILRFGMPPDSAKDGDAPTTPLSQYIALLAKLVGALTDLREEDAPTARTKVAEVFQEAFRSTTALLSEQDGFTRPLIAPLLMKPITFALKALGMEGDRIKTDQWGSGPWKIWHDKLEGKYPFATSRTDAALGDFLDFFAPGDGKLWGFYDESLKDSLERRGSVFVTARGAAATPYGGEFLDVCLKRGQEFTTALFPPKLGQAAVTFDVNLHSVSAAIAEVTFEVDGAAHTYRNEPEQWLTVTWPGKSPHGARLRVRGSGGLNEEISRPGDFGLFRLLDAAEVKPGKAGGKADGSPTLVATWDLKAAKDSVVSLDLRPSRNENPLTPGYFKNYNCPRSITTR